MIFSKELIKGFKVKGYKFNPDPQVVGQGVGNVDIKPDQIAIAGSAGTNLRITAGCGFVMSFMRVIFVSPALESLCNEWVR